MQFASNLSLTGNKKKNVANGNVYTKMQILVQTWKDGWASMKIAKKVFDLPKNTMATPSVARRQKLVQKIQRAKRHCKVAAELLVWTGPGRSGGCMDGWTKKVLSCIALSGCGTFAQTHLLELWGKTRAPTGNGSFPESVLKKSRLAMACCLGPSPAASS